MRYPYWIVLVCAGCAARVATPVPAPAAVVARAEPAPAPVSGPEAAPAVAPAVAAPVAPAVKDVAATAAPAAKGSVALAQAVPAVAAVPVDAPCQETAEALAEDDDEETAAADDGESDGEVGEVADPAAVAAPAGPLYTAELSDEELKAKWTKEPSSLGSMSVGFVESGRIVNGMRFPQGPEWIVVSPEVAYATEETVDYVTSAIREVRSRFPNAPPLRVNGISGKDGGYLRPHKSHQNGRDVDLGFYYPTVEPVREREREKYIDVGLNWALIRALVTTTDVQMILVDRRVQKVLYDYALSIGEDKAWLDSLFNAGFGSLIKHARRHRDHFHVRFYNARAQELGRRVAPLLALQPDHNLRSHRVRSGDTLGGIALRYGSSVASIKKASRLKGTFLRIGQVLTVPLRGPCTNCPIPPAVVLPPRRLPPQVAVPAVASTEPTAATPSPTPCAPAVPPATVTAPMAGAASGSMAGSAGLSTGR